MLEGESKALLSGLVTKLPDLFAQRSESLVEYTRPTRNDFLTVIESELITLDYLPDILDNIQTFVSGYFLSSVSLLVDIPEINVRGTLDQLSTRRDPIENVLGAGAKAFKYVGTEDFKEGLPTHNYDNPPSVCLEDYALEAGYPKAGSVNKNELSELDRKRIEEIDQKMDAAKKKEISDKERMELERERMEILKKGEPDKASVGLGRDAAASVQELSNLSTGKTLEVVFERNGNRATVPVTIRLAVTDTDTESMKSILSVGSVRQTFRERLRRSKFRPKKPNELSMFKDLLFCVDLKEEATKTRIRDKSGFYDHMMRNMSKNFLSGIFSLKPSLNNASAVLITTERTIKHASAELGGDFSEFQVRQRFFEMSPTMIVAVVDTDWDTVTYYHRGIDEHTTVSKRDLSRKKGGGGNQVMDIISAYQAGGQPS